MKYLPLYYEWMEIGTLPRHNGLCNEFVDDDLSFKSHPLFELFIPRQLQYQGRSPYVGDVLHLYWAGEGEGGKRRVGFNPLRQNIVLLMAAMAGEL